MKVKVGDVIRCMSRNGTVTDWLYCGKVYDKYSANRLFYNVTSQRRVGKFSTNFFFKMSIYSFEEFTKQGMKFIKNVGKQKAIKFKNEYLNSSNKDE